MAPPKDIARSYPKRGLTADVGFRSEPKFCGNGSVKLDGSTQGAHVATTYEIAAAGAKTTIAAWVNYDTATVSSARMIAGNTVSGGGRLALYQTATNTLMAGLTYGGGALAFGTPSILSPNRWYFCAATFDNDTATFKFYLDGIEFNTVPTFGGGSTVDQFEIGARYNGGSPLLHFGGKLAHVMMIEDVLTQGEIVELMRDTSYAKAQTFGTVNRYYELDADFNDDTGSHNATSYGSPSFTVDRPQLPRGLDLARGAAMARVYTGRAVDFDGSADRLTAAHYNPSGDYLTTTAWVNADTIRGQGLIHNGNTGRNSFLFYMVASGKVLFYWNDTTGDAYILHQTPLKAGQWHHLAMVLDMSDPADHQVTCYIDGIAATGTRTASGWVGDNTYQFGNQYDTSGWFDGKIADCRIYDVALTQAQVRELYHNPEQFLPTGVSASNLRRYYPLSDYNDTGGTGGRWFQDMGADGEPAEDKGSANMAFAQPVPCPQLGLQQSASRLNMNATTNDTYVRSDLMSGTPFTNQGTLSAWFIMQALPGTAKLDYNSIAILGAYQTDKDLLEIVYDNYSVHGSPNIWITDGSGDLDYATRYNHTFELGKLQHVVITTLATSPYWQLWINGEKKTVSPKNFSSSRSAWAFGDNRLNIGRWGDGPYGGTCRFTSIQTSAWNTVLSDSEIGQVYNSGVPGDVSGIASSNLQVWWKCDDLTSLKDYSGNGVSGAVTVGSVAPGLASFPENASGSTIVGDFSLKRKGVSVLNPAFDPVATASVVGVSAEIPGCDAISFDPTKGMSFTLAFRLQSLKPSPTATWYPRFFTANASGTDYYLRFNSTHQLLQFVLRDSASTSQTYNYTTGTVSDLDWHHIAITVDTSTSPNTTVKLWFDGALINTFASTNHNYAFTPDELRIGTYNYGNGNFPGAIANFRIYQAALSQGEVEQSYSSDLRLIKGLDNE